MCIFDWLIFWFKLCRVIFKSRPGLLTFVYESSKNYKYIVGPNTTESVNYFFELLMLGRINTSY